MSYRGCLGFFHLGGNHEPVTRTEGCESDRPIPIEDSDGHPSIENLHDRERLDPTPGGREEETREGLGGEG